MQNPSELSTLLSAGIQAVFYVGEYQLHLWKPEDGTWTAMVCWYGDGVLFAESSGETPESALWNVSAPAGETGPGACVLAELPARLLAFTAEIAAAAVAAAEAEDRAAGRCVAVAAA